MSSASTHPQPEEQQDRTCPTCDHQGLDAHTYRGFCSPECYHRHRGRKLLNRFRDDHRFCFTCFRQLKRVEKASVRHPDCVTGFQYRTEHARTGEITQRFDDYIDVPQEIERYNLHPSRTGTICKCGSTEHATREGIIQDSSFRTVVGNLYYGLEKFQREGVHDHTIDITELTQALRQQSEEEGWDFALAIGRAIQE